jgi:hypothetical protein
MRVTFWSAHESAALIVENDREKICHVMRHPERSAAADGALAAVARGVDLLIFPGDWEQGLVLKEAAGAKLLALADTLAAKGEVDALAEAATRKSANIFFARHKMSLDL